MKSAPTIHKTAPPETEGEREAKHAAARTERATSAAAVVIAAGELPDGKREPALREALAAARAALAFATRGDAMGLSMVLRSKRQRSS